MIIVAFFAALIIFGCNSCSTSKVIDQESVNIQKDSTYRHSVDSTYKSNVSDTKDTVITDTKIYVVLDSLGNEKSRIEYHNTYKSHNASKGDTAYIVKIDTVTDVKNKYIRYTKTKTVVKEAKPSFLDNIFIWLGKILGIGLLVCFALYFIYRKG